MPHAPFVPLRIFSSFTMLDGAIDPKAIAKLAKERGFPAAAICDRNGLYGAPIFAGAAKGAGVQPVIGTFLAIARPGVQAQGQNLPIDWLGG
ncbi:PHP domain-containing protein, partial [Novosphingobium sp. AP12]|uniref:PHP domain-containing protein n=1 Tax=Novosphingobium sp. AP12 TaxID=1144305 RepID=UPI000272104D